MAAVRPGMTVEQIPHGFAKSPFTSAFRITIFCSFLLFINYFRLNSNFSFDLLHSYLLHCSPWRENWLGIFIYFSQENFEWLVLVNGWRLRHELPEIYMWGSTQGELNATCPWTVHGQLGSDAAIRSVTQAVAMFGDGGLKMCFQHMGEVEPATALWGFPKC